MEKGYFVSTENWLGKLSEKRGRNNIPICETVMSNLLSAKYIFKTYFSRQVSIQQKPHSVIPIEKIPKQEFEKKKN